jgi:hypothetical protein
VSIHKTQRTSEIASVPLASVGENPPAFDHVIDYLETFGYLPPTAGSENEGMTDKVVQALSRFQEFASLPVVGIFDELTREAMAKSRCGLADLQSAAFATTCRWTRGHLTYVLDTGTADTAAQSEWDAVRAAFATWAGLGIFTFEEVKLNQAPDIFIDWRPADDPDLSMVGGVLAHADFPPGCSVVSAEFPKPVHFDDSEHTWAIGAVAGAFDVETVALHEIGHILGLAHSSTPGAVMQPFTSSNSTLRVLTQDDIDGFNSLYTRVPDVVGQLKVQARQMVLAARLVPKFIGPANGIEVRTQSPPPAAMVAPGTVVTMALERGQP